MNATSHHGDEAKDDFDTCKERTRVFARELRRHGVDARWVQVAALHHPASDADPRWQQVPPEARVHYVVQVEGVYVDLAPRQFWPTASVPLTEHDYLRRWGRTYDVTDALDDEP